MKTLSTRDELLDMLPKNLKAVELGVLMGDFAETILKQNKPSELILIDTWEGGIFSGDVDGNNAGLYDGENLYKFVLNRFKDFQNVKIFRNRTEKILDFENEYFDFIYIDADHSYESVKNDLENCYMKIKNGGYLAGHDYGINPSKAHNSYDFGVKRAVDEFCITFNQKIKYICEDGCTSFAIEIVK
jgi:hypothetical protein